MISVGAGDDLKQGDMFTKRSLEWDSKELTWQHLPGFPAGKQAGTGGSVEAITRPS